MPTNAAATTSPDLEAEAARPALTVLQAAPSLSALDGLYVRYGKRLFDLVIGGALLLVAAPVILVFAVAVVVTSGWPPFYAARRVGRHGRDFRMWKLRTMVRDAERRLEAWKETDPELASAFKANFKLAGDPRVTRFGRLLRRFSLDELPQLWNVVRGEMSLVGPRPITQREVSLYGAHAPLLLAAAPGLTGRWQVGGRNAVTYPARVVLELSYFQSISLAQDLQILARTLKAVVGAEGY